MDEPVVLWRVATPDYINWTISQEKVNEARATSPVPLDIKRFETTVEVWDALIERFSGPLHS